MLVPSAAEAESLRNDLARLVSGGRASTDDADRVAYARDLWPRQQIRTRAGDAAVAPPAVIVWPANSQEVAEVLRFAADRTVPVIPYGAGSGVCGGISPSAHTILIDTKRMDAIHTLDGDRLSCRAGAGIVGQNLEDQLNARGYTFGHFPSSIYCSTLGGWIACRAAGQTSGRYGKIEDRVNGVTFVDGTGTIWDVERDGRHSALLPLLIGSEGILGVVTDATLRVDPQPVTRQLSSWLFPTTSEGLDAIRRIYQAGLRPAVARLYDPFDSMISRSFKSKNKGEPREGDDASTGPGLGLRTLVRLIRRPAAINRLIEAADPVLGGAKLVLVWEDDEAISKAELAEAERICNGFGATNTGEGPARHWLAHRHAVSYRQSAFFAAGAFIDTMEVAAPWSKMVPMYDAVRAALSKHVFVMAHFSHAYPEGASIYFTFAGAAGDDDAAAALYDETWSVALRAVVDVGGTLSHHHGVGRSKAPVMRREQGAAIEAVRAIKRALDPAGILNVGSLIPTEGSGDA
ncbi:MAG: FAD-binding oxidoreductase [Myxococcota bacterium]